MAAHLIRYFGYYKALSRSMASSSSRTFSSNQYNAPKSANDMPRYSGVATMMRLPLQEGCTDGLDVCFVGAPMDIGTSNRSGTRHGPRQIRDQSSMIRLYNPSLGTNAFDSLRVADIGDIPINPFHLPKAIEDITTHYKKIVSSGVVPLTLGGDHTITWPILRALKDRHGPLCMVHIDAHSDTNDIMFNEKIAHGTPFRRAVEEGLLDCEGVIQIGLRGSVYGPDDFKWAQEQGFQTIFAHDCWHKSLTPLMEDVRKRIGDRPVYISFDIDGIDPSLCPGTGTPEIGGLTVIQGLEIVRGCRGLNVIGGDLVEVNPLYDNSTCITALTAANLLYEMLCVLPGVKYAK